MSEPKARPALDLAGAIAQNLEAIRALEPLAPRVEEVAERMVRRLRAGGTIFWMGNGGSAAECQHLAAELVGRFLRERRGLASVALTTDTSVLTAIGNDYGYEVVFSRQVEALGRPGDVLVGLSTSGSSPNVVAALRRGGELGLDRVALTGAGGGAMAAECETLLAVPSTVAARVQEAHLLIGHVLCDLVEARWMAGEL